MIKKVAVIGAGVMGHGIAELYALAGFPVAIFDIKEEYLRKAMTKIEENMLFLVQEKVITEQKRLESIQRIVVSTNMEEVVRDADFITEAIPENLELKWDLFNKLEVMAKPDAIIASNTSSFSIAKLAEKVSTAHRLIITHFFYPAQYVPLVEIVKHAETSDEVVQITTELMTRIGKTPIVLKKDIPGLIANRLQTALAREAFHLLQNGVAEAQDIDTAVTAGIGFRWAISGPIETADYGGLDVWKKVMGNLAPELDQSNKAPLIIDSLVEQGKLGVKTGEGVYSHSDNSVHLRNEERTKKFIELSRLNSY